MAEETTLLIVEDTPSLARTYQAHLKLMFSTIDIVDTGAKASAYLRSTMPACILLDLKLPDTDGLELLDSWIHQYSHVPIIVVTANGSMSIAIDSMRRGATDFVVKPTTKDRLRTTVASAISNGPVVADTRTPASAEPSSDFCGIVGRSLAMDAVFKSIESAAPSKANVFVTGETGTGKELVARAVHEMSPRRNASFVAINCGAIPRDLIESEIFGHVKGAFTGATADRIGAAQLAEGGTLFLDELGEMPIELQPKLLRFIQLREFSRVGESLKRKSNIRIVAATNRNPLEAIETGRLREDLYYRLNVIPISLPSLRERGADVLLLSEFFLKIFAEEENKEFTGFSRKAEERLVSYHWPGNVRELENLIRQIVVLNPGGEVGPESIPTGQTPRRVEARAVEPSIVQNAEQSENSDLGLEPLWMTEKKAIERAIAISHGNIVAAAKLLQINPSTIYRKKASWEKAVAS